MSHSINIFVTGFASYPHQSDTGKKVRELLQAMQTAARELAKIEGGEINIQFNIVRADFLPYDESEEKSLQHIKLQELWAELDGVVEKTGKRCDCPRCEKLWAVRDNLQLGLLTEEDAFQLASEECDSGGVEVTFGGEIVDAGMAEEIAKAMRDLFGVVGGMAAAATESGEDFQKEMGRMKHCITITVAGFSSHTYASATGIKLLSLIMQIQNAAKAISELEGGQTNAYVSVVRAEIADVTQETAFIEQRLADAWDFLDNQLATRGARCTCAQCGRLWSVRDRLYSGSIDTMVAFSEVNNLMEDGYTMGGERPTPINPRSNGDVTSEQAEAMRLEVLKKILHRMVYQKMGSAVTDPD